MCYCSVYEILFHGENIEVNSGRKLHTTAKYVHTRSGLTKMYWNSTHRFVIDTNEHQAWMNYFCFWWLREFSPGPRDFCKPVISYLLHWDGHEELPHQRKKQWPLKRSKSDSTSMITRKTFEEIVKDCLHTGYFPHKLFIQNKLVKL